MKLLVSVRDEHEALIAAESGADLIDMKEPRAGALGALPFDAVERIVAVLRRRHTTLRLSATVGDPRPGDRAGTLADIARMAACGVDDVKVGIAAHDASLLTALADASWGAAAIVPVLIADEGVAPSLLAAACEGPFAAVMLDTFDKSRGSLVALRPEAELRLCVETLRRHGRLAGLAGALKRDDVPALRRIAPDFVGFRSAVCDGDRSAALEGERVRRLKQRLKDDRSRAPAGVESAA